MTTNVLDGLLGRVTDSDLRTALSAEVARLRETKEFGLVFERHFPENISLSAYPVRRGVRVQLRDTAESEQVWVVKQIKNGQAVLATQEGLEETRSVGELVVIREFAEPIYPGITRLGSLQRGGTKAPHVLLNAENHHALQTFLYLYEGRIDCIYIDPPYNSGARDWKYNNHYVDEADAYRHSKWLAFMERRLQLAKRLLNPANSVLVVTIDEKEYLRLGLLLEQVFAGSKIQMVSTLINPAVVARAGSFGRSDEYIFFVSLGSASPQRVLLNREWVSAKGRTHKGNLRWDLLRRSGEGSARKDSPGCFYPIYVDPATLTIAKVGNTLAEGESAPEPPAGCVAVLPIRKNRTEGRWQWTPETFRERLIQGRVRVSGSAKKRIVINILKDGEFAKVTRGEFTVVGNRPDGSIIVDDIATDKVLAIPGSQWRISSHDATQYGSRLLTEGLLPGRKFPFPKSLYAVEDTLRFFVQDKPDAMILDFFGGSGTTAHAVMRLNRQDGGRRRCILVTNNEVSADEARQLRQRGLRPGDPEWEELGIFEHVTRPRITAAITGQTPAGMPIPGEYKFTDEFPMRDGFEENVEFLSLTYLDPNQVSLSKAFESIAPLLWMKAGGTGAIIAKEASSFAAPADARYAILFDLNHWQEFAQSVRERLDLTQIFVVTDSPSQYQQVVAELPAGVETSMLYEDYLRNFEISGGPR